MNIKLYALNFGMICFPNAKINIGLRITEKRADGFHNLESCFYPIPWCDILEIIPSDTLTFQSGGIAIPGDATNNLCLKAYHLIRQDYAIAPVAMYLQKLVPIGAGMGGGSSDAAFTLKLLNELFELAIPIEQLEQYARQLGSDCAFFIQNKPVIAIEKGDVFEPCPLNLSGKQLVAVYPNLHISTKEAYSGVMPRLHGSSLTTLLKKNIDQWRYEVSNDFEISLFHTYPVLKEIKETLYTAGALYACMTGSGSTIFGIFDENFNSALLFDNSFEVRKMVLN